MEGNKESDKEIQEHCFSLSKEMNSGMKEAQMDLTYNIPMISNHLEQSMRTLVAMAISNPTWAFRLNHKTMVRSRCLNRILPDLWLTPLVCPTVTPYELQVLDHCSATRILNLLTDHSSIIGQPLV